jgi:hypothetical protein
MLDGPLKFTPVGQGYGRRNQIAGEPSAWPLCYLLIATPASLGETGSESSDSENLRGASQRVADATGNKVARLARVARNALRNGDLHRGAEVLEQIEELCAVS